MKRILPLLLCLLLLTGCGGNTADSSYQQITQEEAKEMMDTQEVISAIENRPAGQSVIVTGRGCHTLLLELADTVSEIRPVKHAFDRGIQAQVGIDW